MTNPVSATHCDPETLKCTGEVIDTMDSIPFEQDLRDLINLDAQYAIFEQMFSREDLMGLYQDMHWLEANYASEFIDSKVKRNYGEFADGDYANYHRVSKVFWLTFIKEHDLKHVPHTAKFKKWIKLLREALNR